MPCFPPGDLPDPGIKPASLTSPALQVDSLPSKPAGKPIYLLRFGSVHFSCSVVSDSLRPHGLQHARPPYPSPTLAVYSNSSPFSWCPLCSEQHVQPYQAANLPFLLPLFFIYCFSSVQFSHPVMSDSLRPHESQHARPPCPSSIPGVHPNSCP